MADEILFETRDGYIQLVKIQGMFWIRLTQPKVRTLIAAPDLERLYLALKKLFEGQ